MTTPETDATKKCPYCAETIKADAVVCRFCGRDLSTTAPRSAIASAPVTEQKQSASPMAVLLAVAAVLCIIVFVGIPALSAVSNLISPPKPTATSDPESLAWTACTEFVRMQLGVPSSDAQRYNPSGVKSLPGDMYEVTVFYENQGSTYKCSLARHPNGDMELLDLSAR